MFAVINLRVSCFNGNRLITSGGSHVCTRLFIKYDDPLENPRWLPGISMLGYLGLRKSPLPTVCAPFSIVNDSREM